jgi:hypothetical protein
MQRKMAIAMYGYSWLKPAGCAKTMLGRREEELEREEVEKQLREVELQERMAMEAEEQERLAQRDERGEALEGRDLDEDIPDADAEEGEDGGYEEDGFDDEDEDVDVEEDGMGMGGDLDDDIPDAAGDEEDDIDDGGEDEDEDDGEGMSSPGDQPYPQEEEGWMYDSRREPDSDSDQDGQRRREQLARSRHAHIIADARGGRVPVPGGEYDYDERAAEDLANAMLDEDEIFDDDHQNNLAGGGEERDLDDDVPDAAAADDEQAWEHTDTEIEESEMDISILPVVGQSGQPGQPHHAHTVGRMSTGRQLAGGSGRPPSGPRSYGSWIAGPGPGPGPGPSPQVQMRAGQHQYRRPTPPTTSGAGGGSGSGSGSGYSGRAARVVSGNRHRPSQLHQHQYTQTPAMLDSPLEGNVDADDDGDEEEEYEDDPFASTGPIGVHARPTARGIVANTYTMDTQGSGRASESPSRAAAARNWLDGAAAAVGGSARRTLFGRTAARRAVNAAAAATAATGSASATLGTGTSSGGLFTATQPGMAVGGAGANANAGGEWETPVDQSVSQGSSQGRTRSGRFLSSRRRADQ